MVAAETRADAIAISGTIRVAMYRICSLTLELSGGEAVRLERMVRAHLRGPLSYWLFAETLAGCIVRE